MLSFCRKYGTKQKTGNISVLFDKPLILSLTKGMKQSENMAIHSPASQSAEIGGQWPVYWGLLERLNCKKTL